ncbi:MAG: topoisomerase DNA-binding C4 zinc finger domain-containing protein, partial [Planctomycetota bacterium]|nr:topoisomerase DNA-binding C4 zinc finger domain-containing protein [Planctomycetota bacterium]
GEVVTDKLIEGFPLLMETQYTRLMEAELDRIANREMNWIDMLREFYAGFSKDLAKAHDLMSHAKAEMVPAIYECPTCGSRTAYRFGKNGRFLSCTAYPDCEYAAPIDREGRPMLPERVNVACPIDDSPMLVRTGRFGKFLASVNYPEIKFVINIDKKGNLKYPAPPPWITDLPCPKCDSPLNLRRGKRGPWLGCSTFPKCRGRAPWTKLEDEVREQLLKALEAHEKAHPQPVIRNLTGTVIPDGTPLSDLTIPGGVQELGIHPDSGDDSHTEAA